MIITANDLGMFFHWTLPLELADDVIRELEAWVNSDDQGISRTIAGEVADGLDGDYVPDSVRDSTHAFGLWLHVRLSEGVRDRLEDALLKIDPDRSEVSNVEMTRIAVVDLARGVKCEAAFSL